MRYYIEHNGIRSKFIPSEKVPEQIYTWTGDNTFVYLLKEVYESFPVVVKEAVTDMFIKNIELSVPEQSIDAIIASKIVFVLYEKVEDIKSLQCLRSIFTDKNDYVVITTKE